MADQDALFEAETPRFEDGVMVERVKESVRALNDLYAIPRHRLYLVQTAVELARNIEAGNRKGRAIANEALQIAAILKELEDGLIPADAVKSDLPADVEAFVNSLGVNPVHAPTHAAAPSHTA